MNLKELRIRNFSGIKNATLYFEGNGNRVQRIEGDFPGTPPDEVDREKILDAVAWTLFGTSQNGSEHGRSVVLEFDHFSVHRKDPNGSGEVSLRLFGYETNQFACAATVKDLSTETVSKTQDEINKIVGCTDIGALRGSLFPETRA
ncbi:MAG: hypothetical protein LLG06_16780 [Desulfobacteraceae bacterium]|nr:hypothetical protein [Desulfobacteraceae bacterium]